MDYFIVFVLRHIFVSSKIDETCTSTTDVTSSTGLDVQGYPSVRGFSEIADDESSDDDAANDAIDGVDSGSDSDEDDDDDNRSVCLQVMPGMNWTVYLM